MRYKYFGNIRELENIIEYGFVVCHVAPEAAVFIDVIQKRQGFKISCPEEIAWRMGFIDDAQLARLAAPLKNSGYGRYLLQLMEDGR